MLGIEKDVAVLM